MQARTALGILTLAVIYFFLTFSFSGLLATPLSDTDFRADHYERDFAADIVRGKGNAWVKRGTREISADEVEVDSANRRATAHGHVHMQDKELHVWAKNISSSLDGDDAVIEDATLISGQMVLTGSVIHRIDAKHYEVDDGMYTNCNNGVRKDSDVGSCSFDWKIYGKHFSINMGGYAHVNDAIIYAKDIPAMYVPYFIFPVKTERQSGFLMPYLTNRDNIGTGFTLPYFWAMSPWQDLTIYPTYFSRVGYDIGLTYRYNYDAELNGQAKVFLLQRRFSSDRTNPGPDDVGRPRFLGVVGEWAADIRNRYNLANGGNTLQVIRAVSNPYYTVDHRSDLNIDSDPVSLRSTVAYWKHFDSTLVTAKAVYHESMIISNDGGVDKGAVALGPDLGFFKLDSPLLGSLFSYEFDSILTNYFRPNSDYDSLSATLSTSEQTHYDPNPSFHPGDYIRAGRRMQLEPRLIANVPMPSGFQLQPILRAGTLAYHFSVPESNVTHREYAQVEVPLSMYLSKNFDLGIENYERVNHVFQPRLVYAKSLYQSGTQGHPFFYDNGTLSNPRFDIIDQLTRFEYMRFELINRVRRRLGNGLQRFVLVQLSEQYNFITSTIDPRYTKQVGPIELLGDIQIGRIGAQVQAFFPLESTLRGTTPIFENDISSSLEYRSAIGDRLSLGNRIHIVADDSQTEKTATFSFYKFLPTFFDLEGGMEYSYKRGELMGAHLGLIFASKPRSCWGLNFKFGQDFLKRKYVDFQFRFDFGNTSGVGI